jgi:hypothetical protein
MGTLGNGVNRSRSVSIGGRWRSLLSGWGDGSSNICSSKGMSRRKAWRWCFKRWAECLGGGFGGENSRKVRFRGFDG